MNLQNLQQENCTLSMIRITQIMVNEMKIVQLKFETKVIKSSLCDYSDAYVLVTGDMTATGGDADPRVAFKNCAPFTKCIIHLNYEHVDGANNLGVIMPMYNLIECSDNYLDTSGRLWQFERDESSVTAAANPDNVSTANSTSFKHKIFFKNP